MNRHAAIKSAMRKFVGFKGTAPEKENYSKKVASTISASKSRKSGRSR